MFFNPARSEAKYNYAGGTKINTLKEHYDKTAGEWLKLKKSRPIKRLGELFIQSLPAKREDALDLGCGTGVFTEYLCGHFNKVCGVDISLEMLALGKKYRDSIDFIQADALSLPFERNSFDMIISSGLIEHIDEHEKLFKEAFRILRSGGLFSVSVLNRRSIWNRYGSWRYPNGLRYYDLVHIKNIARDIGFRYENVHYLFWAGPFSTLLPSWADRLDSILPTICCHRYLAVFSK